MMLAFVLIAVALATGAAALLLRPLLKRRPDRKPDALTAVVVLFALFAWGGGLYAVLSDYGWTEATSQCTTSARVLPRVVHTRSQSPGRSERVIGP